MTTSRSASRNQQQKRSDREASLSLATRVVDHSGAPSYIENYVFTARAVDFVRAFAAGIADPRSSRAITLVGPYGSGKSTALAVLRQLSNDLAARRQSTLWDGLEGVSPTAAVELSSAIAKYRQIEFVALTAIDEDLRSVLNTALAEVRATPRRRRSAAIKRPPKTDSVSVRNVISEILGHLRTTPLCIVIDEFGRRLETAQRNTVTEELTLIQELAELAQSQTSNPLLIVTAQHRATTDYSESETDGLAQELAKIQGRFREISFVESPEATLAVAATELQLLGLSVATKQGASVGHGVHSISRSLKLSQPTVDAIRACYPLSTMACVVLAEFSARYAQSTRTLKAFVSSDDPLSARSLLAQSRNAEILVSDVFDYFVTSQTSSIAAADTDARWREIAFVVRDNLTLASETLHVLKTVAALNLATNGTLKASPSLIRAAVSRSLRSRVNRLLADLETDGLVTYRPDSDEYRTWRGSPTSLSRIMASAREFHRSTTTAELLQRYLPTQVIHGRRHSIERGIDRIFVRSFLPDLQKLSSEPSDLPQADGWLQLICDGDYQRLVNRSESAEVPVVQIKIADDRELHRAAVELAALTSVGRDLDPMDRVLAQEVRERILLTEQSLEKRLEELVSNRRRGSSRLLYGSSTRKLSDSDRLSGLVSAACDLTFREAPMVRNEMVAGRVLSSQGAKSVRLLTEAMVRNGNQPRFGIVGAAAEGSIFDSVIQRSGLLESDNRAANDEVARSWLGLVTALKTALQNSSEGRLEVAHLIEIATRPPYGIRPPLAKLVAMTLIWSRRETIALYEHGSLLLQLDEAAVERLIKNPDHFYLKPLGPTSKTHLNILSELTKLVLPSRSGASMLDVVKALISRLAALPTFSLQTSLGLSTSAIALRRVIRSATEPDSLLFVEIPESLGIAQEDGRSARALAELVLSSIHELEGAYPAMLCEIDDLIRREMRIRKTSEHPSVLLRGAALAIRDNLMDPQLRSLINAILREGLSPSEWTENIAMVVSGLGSPRNWTDEKLLSFRVLLVEQMSTFRRLLGLNIQTAGSSSDPHRFAMLTVTRSDGREEERVIHLTAEHLELASQCSEQALSQLVVTAGSAESARDLMIAALLARSEQSDRSRDLMPKIAEDTYDRGTKEGVGQ